MKAGVALAAGTLLVGLTVSQPAHAAGTPTAVITASPSGDVAVGQPITFDATASTNAAELVWDFDDGGQAAGPVVNHAFTAGGAYVVSLTARSDDGQWTSSYQEVRVTPYVAGKVVEPITIDSGGAPLAGTVTRPDTPGRVPAILEYGPYGAGSVSDANWNRTLVRSGYAYVKVAMPGRWNSGGTFDMFGRITAQGGYDAVEWIARQPWSNGKVGLAGFSGPAVAALDTVTMHPPHLVAASVKGSPGDMYRDSAHVGGTANTNTFVNSWNALFYAEPVATTKTSTRWTEVPTRTADITAAAADMNSKVLYDDWWRERTYTATPATVPVLYYGTHRDLWPRSAPELLNWLAPAGGRVSLVYGGHGPVDPTGWNPAMHVFADGSYSGESMAGETRAWWDHYLKGVDNGVDRRPPLSLLVPRDADWNAARGYRWLGLQGWPDASTSWRTLHLDGNGVLQQGVATTTAVDTSLGGAGWGATGQPGVDDVQNVLYETAPLSDDLTVAGPVALRLFAALAGPDVAWNVQLQEVLPDGSVRQVNDGQLQASQRALDPARTVRNAAGDVVVPYHPHDAIDLPTPGAVTEYEIEIPTVFNTFTRGSRIRIAVVANDARPTLDSHDTAPQSVAFSVSHDAGHPSALSLPVISSPEEHALALPYGGPVEGPPADVPEAPYSLLLPAAAMLLLAGAVLARRRRAG